MKHMTDEEFVIFTLPILKLSEVLLREFDLRTMKQFDRFKAECDRKVLSDLAALVIETAENLDEISTWLNGGLENAE